MASSYSYAHDSSYNSRRSSLMKWLCKLFKGSRTTNDNTEANERWPPRVVGEENKHWREHNRSRDDKSKGNNEELDRAIALSLADENKHPKDQHGQNKNDEEIARQLQESLGPNKNDEEIARQLQESYYPNAPVQYLPRGFRLCAGCHREIGYGHYLSCMGNFWHTGCFCCHSCGHLIRETEFTLLGTEAYHKLCYKEMHHPKCDVCHQFIPINRTGLIEYRAHPFWGQKYCPSHEHDNTPRCCSCERMESRNTKYISLGDGRSLCFECLDSAIMDTGDCQPLYHSIRDYYEGLNMRIDQQIPMLLVERQALNDAMEGEKDGTHHMPETRGLCLSEEQTVNSIFRRPRIGGNRIVGMGTSSQKLVRRCEVTAILVLYGLPRLLTGSILAHELMHGWLRLKGYRNLSPEVEEGICQVLSYLWLESEIPDLKNIASSSSSSAPSSSYTSASSKKGRTSVMEKKLGEFFKHQIQHDTSSAYGDGFRSAYAAVNKYGLKRTLDHIRYSGKIPI